ncbi:MAG TPA: tyrosine--tRNA ligase [Saprospiraceae bacterium]|nr:tyrosine--tRNA ligase [Saprospiraceae bacterium]
MNFIEELRWRGMLHDSTPGVEELLNSKKIVGYIGFDPTAPSMTIGNFVQIMLLKLFQLSGHQPIVLMGGATGRIGDPSFKDKERDLKSYDELDSNLAFQKEQIKKFLDFDGPNAAIIVNNHDFYKEMNILDFLRDVGKTLTVSYMMSKDSVKNRLETGLSFTEFSYQLLQSYDFQLLFDKYNCVLQMGGSDQWGNITSGTEFIRRNIDGKAYAVTTPLLTKADGTKFGKSEQGNIWLDPKLTSAYKFYQFWLNADDADLPKYLRYFTLKSKEEVEALEAKYADDPRGLKAILAEELTRRVHSDEDFESVLAVTNILFGKDANAESLKKMTVEQLDMIAQEIPCETIGGGSIVHDFNIIDILTETGILTSKTEARNAIKGNAISVNKVKISSHEFQIAESEFLHGKYLLIENGKKNKFMIKYGAEYHQSQINKKQK